jgi:CRISPR-associated protein Cmr6
MTLSVRAAQRPIAESLLREQAALFRNRSAPPGQSLPVPRLDVANAGLLLDRFQPAATNAKLEQLQLQPPLPRLQKHVTPLDLFLAKVCDTPVPELYRAAFEAWERTVTALPGVRTARFETQGRMIVGLGGESVRETGIALLHPYGVPYLPGSALKGLLMRHARPHLAARPDGKELARVLGGEPEFAAYLTYFDAWLVPEGGGQRPLVRETLTVHHPRYYNAAERERRAPWDLDDPTPVAWLSARGTFLVAVRGPDEAGAWAELALDLLERLLPDWGIGAKTSSGYGRLDRMVPPSAEAVEAMAQSAAWAMEVAALDATEVATKGSDAYKRLRELRDQAGSLTAEEDKIRLYAAIRAKVAEAGRTEQWKGETWLKNALTFLAAHEAKRR